MVRRISVDRSERSGTVEQGLREFLRYCRVECGFARATLAAYEADLRELCVWMAERKVKSWEGLDSGLIGEHLRGLDVRGLSARSISRHVASIRVFGRYLEASGLVESNAAELLSQPSDCPAMGMMRMEHLSPPMD
jgi:site-specific recombinase XerD